jgi:fatty acid desaturase
MNYTTRLLRKFFIKSAIALICLLMAVTFACFCYATSHWFILPTVLSVILMFDNGNTAADHLRQYRQIVKSQKHQSIRPRL